MKMTVADLRDIVTEAVGKIKSTAISPEAAALVKNVKRGLSEIFKGERINVYVTAWMSDDNSGFMLRASIIPDSNSIGVDRARRNACKRIISGLCASWSGGTPTLNVHSEADSGAIYIVTLPQSDIGEIDIKSFEPPKIPGIEDVTTTKQRENGTMVILDKETGTRYSLHSNGYIRRMAPSTSPYLRGNMLNTSVMLNQTESQRTRWSVSCLTGS